MAHVLLNDAIKQYVKDSQQNLKTVENYVNCLHEFVTWNKNVDLSEISQEHIDDYLLRLIDKGLAINTVNLHSSALKSFFLFCGNKFNFKEVLEFASFRRPEPAGKYINPVDFHKIIDAVLVEQNGIQKIRNLVIIQLLIETGVATAELTGLLRSDIDLGGSKLIVKEASRPDCRLSLSGNTLLLVSRYLLLREDSSGFLFIRFDRAAQDLLDKITSRSIARIVKNFSLAVYHPKDFRFTYMLNQLLLGNGLYVVSENVGGTSDFTKTFLRSQIKKMQKRRIKNNPEDYDTYEYLRHKFGKNCLERLISEDKVEASFAPEVRSKTM